MNDNAVHQTDRVDCIVRMRPRPSALLQGSMSAARLRVVWTTAISYSEPAPKTRSRLLHAACHADPPLQFALP